MIRQLPRFVGVFALAIAIATLAYVGGKDSSAQEQFFQPCTTLTVANPAASTASDISSSFGIGIGDNCVPEPGVDNKDMYNFGGVVNFTPQAWGVKSDAEVDDGTEIGSLSAVSTLGLLNNPCQNTLNVNFTFYDATTDQSKPIDLPAPGTTNRMKILMDDADGNGNPDGADKWPTYLTELFAVRNNANLDQLHARYLGVATVAQASNLVVILNFMVFEPGATITDDPVLLLDPRAGYASVTVLQDPTGAASAADFITDFCSPLLTNATILSNIRTNPPDGTYSFFTAVASSRDADGDGFENQLDTCPLVANQGNPRNSPDTGDQPDNDGIDNACDPEPARGKGTCGFGASNCDEDGDRWANRGDNCVLVANELQEDDDSDSIGDACDPNRGDANAQGTQIRACLKQTVVIGAGGAEAVDPLTIRPCNPNAEIPATGGGGSPTPVNTGPTPVGQTPAPTRAGTGPSGGGVGPASGIGSLSPVNNGIPMWAAALTAIGALGLVGGGSLMAVRTRKRD